MSDHTAHTTYTSARRWAGALGATGLLTLALAAPASARPDPGTGGLHERTGQPEATTFEVPPPILIPVDDNAVEYLQLGAGILAGIALAGAGAVAASRYRHAHPHAA